MRQLTTILLAISLTGCGASKKSEAPTEEPTTDATGPVELKFAWPAGISGSVERRQFEQIDDESEQSSVVYSVTTRPVEGGTELTYSDPREMSIDGVSDQQARRLKPMFEAVPTIVFAEGKVVSIDNAERMRAVVDQLAPIPEDAPPDVKARMEQTRSPAFFLDAAKAEWATLTTVWHGKTLSPNDPVVTQTQTRLLGLQGPITATIRMELKERLPCPGATEKQCVRLIYSSTPDAESLRTAAESMATDAARQGVQFELKSLSRSFEVELVTDPATLLPYEFTSNEVTELSAKQDGKPIENRRVKRRTETYRWD